MPGSGEAHSVGRVFRALPVRSVVIDIVIAVGFLAIALPVEVQIVPWAGLEQRVGTTLAAVPGIAVAIVFAAALAVRRLAPGLALGAAWAGAVLQMGFGRPPSFSDAAVFAVLYTAAAYGTRQVFWVGLGSAIAGAGIGTVYLFVGPLSGGAAVSWETLPVAAIVLVAAVFALGLSWTIGALVRTSRRARETRQEREVARAETAAEAERVRIARDMHDVVAHSLAVVIAQADGARYATAADPAAAPAALATISATARDALADVRLLLTQLRHSQSEGPQPTLADLEGLYAQVREAGVDLRVDVDPMPIGDPPAGVQLAVFRIVQEALTNALRHGDHSSPVEVGLRWLPERVEVEIENVVAPAASVPAPAPALTDAAPAGDLPRGHGLIGMRERAQLVGGKVDAGADGPVFRVRAVIPVPPAPGSPSSAPGDPSPSPFSPEES